MSAQKALALKEEGNAYFSRGDFTLAERHYTLALQAHPPPKPPHLFTNRAMARLKLLLPSEALDDALHALDLDPHLLKGHYYLAQAQLALHHPNEAYVSALKAYERAKETGDKSLASVAALVREAKKGKWARAERERERRRSALLDECTGAIESNAATELAELKTQQDISEPDRREAKREIELAREKKVEELRTVFAIADPENVKRRDVPDYLIDPVTFAVMVDPVTTPNGISYERATILEHLKRSARDPLTGEAMGTGDLRANLGLRAASEEFLEKEGWAVDW